MNTQQEYKLNDMSSGRPYILEATDYLNIALSNEFEDIMNQDEDLIFYIKTALQILEHSEEYYQAVDQV